MSSRFHAGPYIVDSKECLWITAVSRQDGLPGRGVLKPGNYADICIFDPESVIDTADFATPISPAKGIDLVIVNGCIVWQGGMSTANGPGRALLRHKLQDEAYALTD